METAQNTKNVTTVYPFIAVLLIVIGKLKICVHYDIVVVVTVQP